MAYALKPRFSREIAWADARAVGLYVAMLTASACTSVSSDNIQLWKATEKGPTKLAAALADSSVEPKLRAEAAVALVDIGRADEVEASVAAMPADQRSAVVNLLVPLFIAAAKTTAPEKSLAYRDALFSTRSFALPETQRSIDGFLLPAIAQQLRSGRTVNGRHSVEKMLLASGTSSIETLIGLLAEPLTGPAEGTVAELLSKLGDEAARDRGAINLVARARKERPTSDVTWRSIGLLGGPASAKFLEEQIQSGRHADATAAARALQQRREPRVLPLALRVAADPRADRTVRDEMFGVVESIGGLEARDGMIHLIGSDREEIVRYRAFESLLAVAKESGIVAGLDAFPSTATYKKVDVEDLLVKLIEKLGAPARPELLKALASKSPLTRISAVMSLELLGKAPDGQAIGALMKDTTTVRGFPVGDTVGKEASRVAAAVGSKT